MGGRELRLRRLKPLAWFSAKNVGMMPMATCASAMGGSGGAMAAAAAAGAKRECVCVQNLLC